MNICDIVTLKSWFVGHRIDYFCEFSLGQSFSWATTGLYQGDTCTCISVYIENT